MRYIFLSIYLLVLMAGSFSRLQAQQTAKPNIIFFMVDDMGWQDCSLPFTDKPTPLNAKFHTPNMERLARMGVKFTNGYANPVCTPSRVSLMTGMDVPSHHVTNWTNVQKDTPTDYPDSLLLPPVWNHNGMTPVSGIPHAIEATPLPQLLKDAGYHTIHVGKAHFAPYETPAGKPENIGFAVNVAGTAAGHPGSFLASDHYRGQPKDTFWAVRDLEKHIAEGEFLTEALTHAALEELEKNRQTQKPFFLYLSHYAVHVPLSKDDRFYERYIRDGLDDKEARFAALVEGMDKSLGDLLDYLEKTNQTKNTYIVFMSDNGSLSLVPPRGGEAFTHNLPLRQGKGSIYEGGIRVPLLVAGPNIPKSKTQNQYVGIHDLFPTLLSWAGVNNPKLIQKVDGQSIIPYLSDFRLQDDKKILLWHYPNNWTNINVHGISWASAMRKGKYKIIYFHKSQKLELYDLSTDLGESHDLSALLPDKLKEMAILFTQELKKRDAPMPVVKATGKQIPWPDAYLKVLTQTHRKNVLILYSDDHSYHALGAMGNHQVLTPNLDRLAKEGMLFRQTHVMGGHQGAVCIPSRVMMLTGRYVNRLPGDGSTIPDSIVGMPEVLRGKGYSTFHTGKWHSDKASHSRFFSDGGDIFFGGMHFPKEGGQEHPVVYQFDSTGKYPETLKRVADTFSSALYAENAIRFLNSQQAKNNPFFCYVAFTSPHDPRTPPKAFVDMYADREISMPANFRESHPFDNGDMNVRDEQLLPRPLITPIMRTDILNYYAMITEMDHQVGRILVALERNGLHENTIIVFAGDNGLAMGQHGLLGKQNLYEHSIRVPMIMAGPGIPKGSTYSGFNYLSDIAPTLYDYLQITPPVSVEGKSHASVFMDTTQRIRKHIYNVYGHWSRSYKSGDGFKLILYNVDGVLHTQLFNLQEDPWEMQDLSGQPEYRQKIAELTNLLRKEMAETHDNLDITLPNWGRQPTQKPRGS